LRRVVVQPDLAHAAEPQPQRFVGGVEVVLGRDRLPALLDARLQPGVDESEPHRGRIGQREVGRVDLEVARGRLRHALVERDLVLAQVAGRVDVEPAAVAVDRRPHGPRVRSEHEAVEVADIRRERELRLDCRPAMQGGRLLRGAAAARHDARSGRTGQQLLARESSHSPTLRRLGGGGSRV